MEVTGFACCQGLNAMVCVPGYAGATPGQKPLVGFNLRNQGMEEASPEPGNGR